MVNRYLVTAIVKQVQRLKPSDASIIIMSIDLFIKRTSILIILSASWLLIAAPRTVVMTVVHRDGKSEPTASIKWKSEWNLFGKRNGKIHEILVLSGNLKTYFLPDTDEYSIGYPIAVALRWRKIDGIDQPYYAAILTKNQKREFQERELKLIKCDPKVSLDR